MAASAIELTAKTTGSGRTDATVTLPYALRQKSRQRLRLDDGRDAALVLAPGTALVDGDHLHAADGFTVRVAAASEPLSIARTDDPLRLARACYHLGNRHVALQVGPGWVRYLPDHVLDDMVRGLGLAVAHESAPFEPERGAYAASGHRGAHAHGHGGDGHHHHDGGHDASTHAHGHVHGPHEDER